MRWHAVLSCKEGMTEHVHKWEDSTVGCEDCGDHPAVRCVNEPCPDDFDSFPIDLVRQDDPREEP